MNISEASLEQMRTTAIDLAMRFGPKVLVAAVILTIGVIVSRWISRSTAHALARFELEPPVRLLLARCVWLLSFALFLVIALENLGVELLPVIAGVGVAGAGVALATQGVLSSLVAGLTIIFTKPFRVGEYISIAGEEGTVQTITLFSTTLGHPDRSRIVIPNRKVVGEILHNFGNVRQVDVAVGVAYDTDMGGAFDAVREVLLANPRVLKEPAPVILTSLLGDSSVSIAVRPWVAVTDYTAATGEINRAVLETFRRRGIVMPFPQREVRVIGHADQALAR
jgi:small conductance mechanosensitive channel